MQRTANCPKTRRFGLATGAALFLGSFFASSLRAVPYNAAQIEIGGTTQIYEGGAAWGDVDNDGDLDFVVSGRINGGGTPRRIRVYVQGPIGTFTGADVESTVGQALRLGDVALADLDNDGWPDVLVSGTDNGGTNAFLRVYWNNATGVAPIFNPTQTEIDGTNGGLRQGNVAAGDFDGDGDLDVAAMGFDTAGARQLRVYLNNGNQTFAAPVSLGTPLSDGSLALGDLDNDGDLDIAAMGQIAGGGNDRRIQYYLNNNGFTAAQAPVDIESTVVQALRQGDIALGDFNGDQWLDAVVTGYDGANAFVRIYLNNGNGAAPLFNATQTELEGTAALRVRNGGIAVGDTDRDGDLDVLVNGLSTSAVARRIRVYQNTNGLGTAWAGTEIETTAGQSGMDFGRVAWADASGDGRLDILATGQDDGALERIRVYNGIAPMNVNAAPATPTVFSSTFAFTTSGISTATFKWNAAADTDAAGATPAAMLVYDLEVSTTAAFTGDSVFPSMMGASPRRGAYHRPPVLAGQHTVFLKSTAPWAAGNAPYGLRTDTTYYYRVRTVDAGLRESVWSSSQSLWTGVAPSTSTIAAAGGVPAGSIAVSWNSAGDDASRGNITGTYRIQYSSNSGTAWSTSTIPSGATNVDLSPIAQAPGSAQSTTVTGLTIGTTYYFVLWTQDDAGLWSAISNMDSALPTVPPAPGASVLTVAAATVDGQIVVNWNAPTNSTGGTYDMRWSLSAITSDALFNAATPLAGEPAAGAPGAAQTMFIAGVPPERTVFFALKTTNSGGTSPLSNSPSGTPLAFDRTQIEVSGVTGEGLDRGDASWADMDGDGYWDIVAMGMDQTNTRRLRVYRNNQAGGFVLDEDLTGLSHGNLDLGDFDGDGDLDVAASGNDGTNRNLRVHVNNSVLGNISLSTGTPVQAGNGFDYTATNASGCGLKWADMNSDGDLDIVVCGQDTASGLPQLYLYFNQGNGTFAAPIDLTPGGSPHFYQWGDVEVADFDGDGRPDIVAQGFNEIDVTAGNTRILLYRNLGGGAFTSSASTLNTIASGGLDAGDYNNDGRPDLLISGYDGNGGNGRDVWVHANTSTPGTISFAAGVNLDAGTGLNRGEVAWGDYNNDGRLDALVLGAPDGAVATDGEIRLYAGTTTGSGFLADAPMDTTPGLVNEGAAAWGDYDQDGDLDVLVAGRTEIGAGGSPELRVYVNNWSNVPGAANNPPSAPATLAATFDFSATGTSTATFKWSQATDDITAGPALLYQVQAATTTPLFSYATPLAINTPSPQTFPSIYGGGTPIGTVLVSTNPWDPQSGTLTGLVTDTTYYFHVKTIDGGALESGWSADATLWTGVAPGTSTIAAGSGVPGQATMTWTSAGDDQNRGNLTGNYRIQFSTDPATAWSTSSNPVGASTVTVSTTAQAPGSAQLATITGLIEGTSYYFVLWTQDDAGQWSAISNQTTAYVRLSVRDVSITETEYVFGNVPVGQSTQTSSAITVTYEPTSTANGTYRLYASTVTPGGSPWSLSASTGPNMAVLSAVFNAGQPSMASFVAPEDVVLTGSKTCTASVFAQGQTCLNLSPGTARSLWLRLDLPSESDTDVGQEQRIQLTVEAGP